MAMLYQSLPNTLTVESQTAGTDGNMTFVDLPGGIKTAFYRSWHLLSRWK